MPFGSGIVVQNYSGMCRAQHHDGTCHVIRGDVHGASWSAEWVDRTEVRSGATTRYVASWPRWRDAPTDHLGIEVQKGGDYFLCQPLVALLWFCAACGFSCQSTVAWSPFNYISLMVSMEYRSLSVLPQITFILDIKLWLSLWNPQINISFRSETPCKCKITAP